MFVASESVLDPFSEEPPHDVSRKQLIAVAHAICKPVEMFFEIFMMLMNIFFTITFFCTHTKGIKVWIKVEKF